MAQQPNIELDSSDLPRSTLATAAARPWKFRPGMITSPDQVPTGAAFGSPGPDTGWALKVIHAIEDRLDPDLEAVLVALMAARAADAGRAPIPEDLAVAKLLAGIGDGLPVQLAERCTRWTDAVPHEKRKGRTAVGEVPADLLAGKPDEVRAALLSAG